MKDKILYPQPLILFLESFFELRTLAEHLCFFEEWMQLVMTDEFYTKKHNPADILYFHDQFLELYKHSSDLIEDQIAFGKLNLAISSSGVNSKLNDEPQYLSDEETVNPLLALQIVFKDFDFAYYKSTLRHWLEESLNAAFSDVIGASIFPLYSNTKKLIEACWLLHNCLAEEHQETQKLNTLIYFEQTCPLLVQQSHVADPYLEIESFFRDASLGEYRKDLKNWFRAALTKRKSFKRSNTLIYFHGRLIQLIHAGYLIINNNLVYQRDEPYCSNAITFKDWINGMKTNYEMENGMATSAYDVYALSDNEKLRPLEYLSKTLKLRKIKQLRYGLQEWLYCGLSNKNSLMGIDDKYILKLYETLEKLLEAFFLLIAGNHVNALLMDEKKGL